MTAALDAERRGFLRRNHTATHLLDAALKQVLGEHVSQAGSLVTPEHLRFDFTHFEALSSEQLKAVEDLVNQQIFASKPVVTRVMGIDEAKAAGAVALFGEKYGDVVRVVSVGAEDQPFSRELCGGTHAANTAEIGLFKIISESSTGSNVRRIEAVTSKGALDYMADRLALVDAAAAALKCRVDEVPARVENLQAELRETSNKLKKALTGGSSDAISSAIEGAVELDGYKLVVAELQGLEAADLRNVWDTVHQKVAGPVACVVASVTEKGTPALLAAGSDDAVKAGFHAGNVIKQIAGLVDGRGGGVPTWPRPVARTPPVSPMPSRPPRPRSAPKNLGSRCGRARAGHRGDQDWHCRLSRDGKMAMPRQGASCCRGHRHGKDVSLPGRGL